MAGALQRVRRLKTADGRLRFAVGGSADPMGSASDYEPAGNGGFTAESWSSFDPSFSGGQYATAGGYLDARDLGIAEGSDFVSQPAPAFSGQGLSPAWSEHGPPLDIALAAEGPRTTGLDPNDLTPASAVPDQPLTAQAYDHAGFNLGGNMPALLGLGTPELGPWDSEVQEKGQAGFNPQGFPETMQVNFGHNVYDNNKVDKNGNITSYGSLAHPEVRAIMGAGITEPMPMTSAPGQMAAMEALQNRALSNYLGKNDTFLAQQTGIGPYELQLRANSQFSGINRAGKDIGNSSHPHSIAARLGQMDDEQEAAAYGRARNVADFNFDPRLGGAMSFVGGHIGHQIADKVGTYGGNVYGYDSPANTAWGKTERGYAADAEAARAAATGQMSSAAYPAGWAGATTPAAPPLGDFRTTPDLPAEPYFDNELPDLPTGPSLGPTMVGTGRRADAGSWFDSILGAVNPIGSAQAADARMTQIGYGPETATVPARATMGSQDRDTGRVLGGVGMSNPARGVEAPQAAGPGPSVIGSTTGYSSNYNRPDEGVRGRAVSQDGFGQLGIMDRAREAFNGAAYGTVMPAVNDALDGIFGSTQPANRSPSGLSIDVQQAPVGDEAAREAYEQEQAAQIASMPPGRMSPADIAEAMAGLRAYDPSVPHPPERPADLDPNLGHPMPPARPVDDYMMAAEDAPVAPARAARAAIQASAAPPLPGSHPMPPAHPHRSTTSKWEALGIPLDEAPVINQPGTYRAPQGAFHDAMAKGASGVAGMAVPGLGGLSMLSGFFGGPTTSGFLGGITPGTYIAPDNVHGGGDRMSMLEPGPARMAGAGHAATPEPAPEPAPPPLPQIPQRTFRGLIDPRRYGYGAEHSFWN